MPCREAYAGPDGPWKPRIGQRASPRLTTTLNVYLHQVDDGLGGADVWNGILGDGWGHRWATEHPETAEIGEDLSPAESHD